MDREKLDNHFRRGRALLGSLTSLIDCAIGLPDQGDGTSQALVGCIFLTTELTDELQKIEEVTLWLDALASGKPQAND